MSTKWNLEPTHSEVLVKVKHLMISNVTATFKTVSGSIEAEDASFQNATVNFSADVKSINTHNEQRDAHVAGSDFFDAEKFPQITFEAKGFNPSEGKINGNLTIKGVTKAVSFHVEFNGTAKDPWGNEKVGFSVSGQVNRKDFGIEWNAPLETGGVLISEEVKLNAELQFVKA